MQGIPTRVLAVVKDFVANFCRGERGALARFLLELFSFTMQFTHLEAKRPKFDVSTFFLVGVSLRKFRRFFFHSSPSINHNILRDIKKSRQQIQSEKKGARPFPWLLRTAQRVSNECEHTQYSGVPSTQRALIRLK